MLRFNLIIVNCIYAARGSSCHYCLLLNTDSHFPSQSLHHSIRTHLNLPCDLYIACRSRRVLLQNSAALNRYRSRRAADEVDFVQLDVLVPPALVIRFGRGACCIRHSCIQHGKSGTYIVECSVLQAVKALPYARAGLSVWPPESAPKEHPELREAHAEDPRCKLS